MNSHEHLMLAPLSMALVDIATDLAMPVVAGRGLSALTPAAVAEAAGCSRQAVHQWFGSRAELQRAVSTRFVARWTRWQDVRSHFHGLPGLLPDSEPVLGWTRVWLALLEASHRDLAVGEAVDHARRSERQLVRRVLRADAQDQEVERCHALLEGLRLRLASGRAPGLAWAEAAWLLPPPPVRT